MLCELLLAFVCLIGWIYFSTLAKIASEEQPFQSPQPAAPTLQQRKAEAAEIVQRLMAEARAKKAAHNHNH